MELGLHELFTSILTSSYNTFGNIILFKGKHKLSEKASFQLSCKKSNSPTKAPY